MKRLLVLILISSIHSAYAIARVDDPGANCATKALPSPDKQAEVGEFEKVLGDLEEHEIKKLKLLANNICSAFDTAQRNPEYDLLESVNSFIVHHLELDKEKNNTEEIFNFWKDNSKYLICELENAKARTSQHVLKRAIALEYHQQVFYQYLFRIDEPDLVFNAVEIVDNRKETILDYIDDIIASDDFEKHYNTGEVKKLRKLLANKFNAKTAIELEGIANN